MKLLVTMLSISSLCTVFAQQQSKPFDRFVAQTGPDGNVITFYNTSNEVIATVIGNKQKLTIKTPNGREDWVTLAHETQGQSVVHTWTTASDKNLRFMVTYNNSSNGQARKIAAIQLWQNSTWVNLVDARALGKQEKQLFDTTPELSLLYTLLGHVVPGESAGSPPPIQLIPNSAPSCGAKVRIVPIASTCRATCARMVFLSPIFICTDNALPDACPCPQAVGIWDLSCCCGFFDFTCLVDCSRFPLPPPIY